VQEKIKSQQGDNQWTRSLVNGSYKI
jgi:hypothetical protein